MVTSIEIPSVKTTCLATRQHCVFLHPPSDLQEIAKTIWVCSEVSARVSCSAQSPT